MRATANRSIFVAAIILTACFVGGCSRENWDLNAQKNFKLASQAYELGDYPAAVEFSSKSLKDMPRRFSNENALEALYLQGMAEYHLKRYELAARNLQYVVDKTDNPDLEIRASDTLGEVLFLQGDNVGAMKSFNKVASLAEPKNRPSDHSEYRRGCIAQQWGQWKNADLHFQRVIYHFPKTELARISHQRCGGRYWAIKGGVFASKDKAAEASKKFSQAKMVCHVRPVICKDDLKFHLLVGRYPDYGKAKKDLAKARKINPDCQLVVAK